jgi:hypothetical protein
MLHMFLKEPRQAMYTQGGPKVDIHYIVYSIITVYLLLADLYSVTMRRFRATIVAVDKQ